MSTNFIKYTDFNNVFKRENLGEKFFFSIWFDEILKSENVLSNVLIFFFLINVRPQLVDSWATDSPSLLRIHEYGPHTDRIELVFGRMCTPKEEKKTTKIFSKISILKKF